MSDDRIRLRTEQNEKTMLSQYATLCTCSAGRAVPEPEDSIRTCFQRDRDRIIHCNSFRRLKHKTQVFLAPEGDHYRTRLTHTLEVSQIARTISRALRLNEDLTEAIALGHDLGHTPFGHAGERALNKIFPDGFTHYDHSIRVVSVLEKNCSGLNLTSEVLDGIKNHTTGQMPSTLEGCVVRLSDRIAYINHDIDDAIRAGVLKLSDIPSDILSVLGETHSARIGCLVNAVVESSEDKNEIIMPEPVASSFEKLHAFMFDKVYRDPVAKAYESKAIALVEKLYLYFSLRPNELPDMYKIIAGREGAKRAATDYIAGMSDRYAIEKYSDLFIPRAWR